MIRTVRLSIRQCLQQYKPERTVTTTTEKNQDKLKIPSHPPTKIKNDWIGPPDPDSNLRPIKFYVPADETDLEKEYRLRRDEIQEWNHLYWSKHNRNFIAEKERYIEENLNELGKIQKEGSLKKLSPEELSKFYKKFLESNHKLHSRYNREWYQKNISLLWPAFRIQLQKLFSGR